MKTLLPILLISLLSFNAHAISKSEIKYCTTFSELGEVYMEARQNNIPLEDLITRSDGNKVTLYLITSAYSYSIRASGHSKELAIRDFKEQMMLTCIKGI